MKVEKMEMLDIKKKHAQKSTAMRLNVSLKKIFAGLWLSQSDASSLH